MEIPTPQIVCDAAGHHAVCPACGQKIEVPVQDIPFMRGDPPRKMGFTTAHDTSAYEKHYAGEH
jgi:Fe2+ or Zn2+ uptake regulation protein